MSSMSMDSCHWNRQVLIPFVQMHQKLGCLPRLFGKEIFCEGHLNWSLDRQFMTKPPLLKDVIRLFLLVYILYTYILKGRK